MLVRQFRRGDVRNRNAAPKECQGEAVRGVVGDARRALRCARRLSEAGRIHLQIAIRGGIIDISI